jgi:hypothetical protein
MLRIAAYTNGRRAVNEYDVLLLQHVLWQRPEEAERIRDWLLERIVKDGATEQVSVRALRGQPQHPASLPLPTPSTLCARRCSFCCQVCMHAPVVPRAKRRTAARSSLRR